MEYSKIFKALLQFFNISLSRNNKAKTNPLFVSDPVRNGGDARFGNY